MLPSWFAEYSLDLAVIGLVLAMVVALYGWIVLSTGRLAGILRDVSRGRRPTAVVATIATLAGIVLAWAAVAASAYHVRLALAALATVLMLAGLSSIAMYPVPRIWTNDFWRIPLPNAIRDDQVRVLGKVYLVLGIAFIVASAGNLIGLVPKLVYVGTGPVPIAFLICDIVVLAVAAVIAVKAWRIFQTVQVRRAVQESAAR